MTRPSQPLAQRMERIAPFHVMEVMRRAAELERSGRRVIHMEVGEPDFPPADPVVEAGIAALRAGRTRYSLAAGVPELREAIAARHAGGMDPGRVFVTPGASGALLVALGLVTDPGDRVLLPDPGYPCNRHFVELVNGVPRDVAAGPETRYQPDVAAFEAAWEGRVAALLAASPANPTGTTLDPEQLAALGALARNRRAALIVDEIYHGLHYSEGIGAAVRDAPDAFVVNSFSKYYGMTGWRLGWLVVPEGYQGPAEKLIQNLFIAAPTPAQHAALGCFSPAATEIFEARRQAFQARRDFLLPALRELGFRVAVEPEGAFYIYADCSALAGDSEAFCLELLEQAGVAATPGLDFGRQAPRRHLRFTYTADLPVLEEAVERIAGFLGRG